MVFSVQEILLRYCAIEEISILHDITKISKVQNSTARSMLLFSVSCGVLFGLTNIPCSQVRHSGCLLARGSESVDPVDEPGLCLSWETTKGI